MFQLDDLACSQLYQHLKHGKNYSADITEKVLDKDYNDLIFRKSKSTIKPLLSNTVA